MWFEILSKRVLVFRPVCLGNTIYWEHMCFLQALPLWCANIRYLYLTVNLIQCTIKINIILGKDLVTGTKSTEAFEKEKECANKIPEIVLMRLLSILCAYPAVSLMLFLVDEKGKFNVLCLIRNCCGHKWTPNIIRHGLLWTHKRSLVSVTHPPLQGFRAFGIILIKTLTNFVETLREWRFRE